MININKSGFFEYNKEAEISVLGCIMEKPETLKEAEKYITGKENFFISQHQTIWEAIKNISKANKPADMVMITSELKRMNMLTGLNENTSMVKPDYLVYLREYGYTTSLIAEYAKEIRKYYIKRKIHKLSVQISLTTKKPFEECIAEASKLVRKIEQLKLTNDSETNSVSNLILNTKEKIDKETNIIPYGIPFLDYSANGTTRGGVSVLGGRPGHGKTTLATNIGMSVTDIGYKVLMFNRQIPNDEILKKMIVIESGVLSYGKIRQGKYKYNINKEKILNLTKEEMEKIEEATLTIRKKYKNFIMIDDIRTIDESITAIKNIEPDYVIDDYVQLIKGSGKYEGRRFEVEDIMMEYEWQAKPSNLNFAALLLSQLSREIEKRLDQMPRISDFSEAGAIEQIAESAFFIFYGYNFDSELYAKHRADIIFGKTRYGNLNSHKIGYNGDKCKYYLTIDEALGDK